MFVIQGKLMFSGKLVAAVVNGRGNLKSRLSFSYAGHGDERIVNVSGNLNGEAEPRVVSVILKNAKTSNTLWVKSRSAASISRFASGRVGTCRN